MSVRRKTDRRLTLIRPCGTCGQSVITSAASPFMRQVPRDGKRQAITYYCCHSCYVASFKHLGFYARGRAEKSRGEREKNRDRGENNRRYYEEHAEEIKAKKRAYYAANPGLCAQNSRYYREKQKLLAAESANGGQAS